jgi:hypothetical protein
MNLKFVRGVVLRAACKLLFLLGLALFLPRFLLLYAPQYQILSGRFGSDDGNVQLGVESFLDYVKSADINLKGKKVLLVTNQIKDKNSNFYLQFLGSNGIVPSTVCQVQKNYIFTKFDYDLVDLDSVKMPVKILDVVAKKDIKAADIVVVDLQNSGFVQDDAINNLINVMQLCELYQKKLILLDRPNPLGSLIEGPLVNVSEVKKDFVLPLRYGMSLGEVASYVNEKLFKGSVSLTILPLKKYLRDSHVEFDKLQKVYTSGLFNMLNGVCPADVKSDCRGKFQCFALPEYLNFPINKWYELRAVLQRYNIDVSLCRYFNRRTEQYFVGVRLIIHDINRVSYLKVWQVILRFMNESNITLRQTLLLNSMFGIKNAKKFIDGELDHDSVDLLNKNLKDFYKDSKSHFIYRPWPSKVLL